MHSQEKISQMVVGPGYVHPETGKPFGEKGIPDIQRNRGFQVSRDDDSVENLKIGIRDIDEAIVYYFKNVIRPQVRANGVVVDVPIMYASPEKWVDVQKIGYYRDKNGKRQVPVIVFKRESLTKDRSITTKLDANRPHNYYVTSVNRSRRNAYTRFDLLHNRVPEKDLIMTVVPDYVKLEYSCVILTDLISQMNPIVEAINFASESYWGDPDRFKFQAFIDSFKTDIDAGQGEDRTVKTTFSIRMNGYILPDTVNANPHTNMKRHNKTNISYRFSEGVFAPCQN